MKSKPAPLLHPLLASRWSPTRFDVAAEVGSPEIESLLEAARWAPSAGNSQPWAFIVGRRGDEIHQRLASHLARSSAVWAPSASLLIANLCHRYVQDTDWEYSEFSLYDLGQAVAHMTLQAQSLGLSTRQFRAFDRDAVSRDFALPPHWQVATMSALGSEAGGAPAGSTHPPAHRTRRTAQHLLWPEAAREIPR
ncbi:nitroreductase [Nakamurella sp. UYEF19]|uniref:nitroreductase family protein n=1 Tax=Nakamurella sp. UYEF19 TaxID=1756392 RepID=UPI003394FEBF